MEKKRSVGVLVIGIIGSIYFIYWTLYTLHFVKFTMPYIGNVVQGQIWIVGWNSFIMLVLPIGSIGILFTKKWARFILMFWAIGILITKLLMVVRHTSMIMAMHVYKATLSTWFPIVFSIVTIYYLTRPQVKEQFR